MAKNDCFRMRKHPTTGGRFRAHQESLDARRISCLTEYLRSTGLVSVWTFMLAGSLLYGVEARDMTHWSVPPSCSACVAIVARGVPAYRAPDSMRPKSFDKADFIDERLVEFEAVAFFI
jgi:hypothetical protein